VTPNWVKQFGTIDGEVIRVGGVGDTIPVLLESEGKQIAGCYTSRQLAKELAKRLFEPVRVVGMGLWARDAEGDWGLRHFRIETFEPLDSAPLSEAVAKLRAIQVDLGSDPYAELKSIRHGRAGDGGT
jgi:hypothetical protein